MNILLVISSGGDVNMLLSTSSEGGVREKSMSSSTEVGSSKPTDCSRSWDGSVRSAEEWRIVSMDEKEEDVGSTLWDPLSMQLDMM